MGNPFDYILKEREEHERKLQRQQREKELSDSHRQSIYQERAAEKHRYDGLVNDVLDQLRHAAYPSLDLYSDDQGWSIGMWMKRTDGSIGWYSALDVRLEHDLNNRAVAFICSRHHLRIHCDPSREDLIGALQRFYPPIQGETKGRRPGRKKSQR